MRTSGRKRRYFFLIFRAINYLISHSLHWRHNDHGGVSNHQPHDCLLNRLFSRRSKKTSKLRVTGLCAGKSPGPVISPHKGTVRRKMFSFDDVIVWVIFTNHDWIIILADSGLSLSRHLHYCWHISNCTFLNRLHRHLIQNIKKSIQERHLKMSSAECRSYS